jgi:hypothetical protein
MARLSFKLDQLFTLHIPILFIFVHGSQKALEAKDKNGWMWDGKKTKRAVCRWQQQRK